MAELERASNGSYHQTIDEMRELVGETRQAIQAISFLTHPPQLNHVTLPEALEALVKGFGRRTGLDVAFEVGGEVTLGRHLSPSHRSFRFDLDRRLGRRLQRRHAAAPHQEFTVGSGAEDAAMAARPHPARARSAAGNLGPVTELPSSDFSSQAIQPRPTNQANATA